MTIKWDPWHTLTVTAVPVPVPVPAVPVPVPGTADAENPDDPDDVELVFALEHPEPHGNGCPEHCMTQQEIDQGSAHGLPTEPGVYRIRAWGEYWPATLAGDAAEFDGGVEAEPVAVAR